MSELAHFFDFLRERIGLDVASVGEATIERALRHRCTVSHSPDTHSYWTLLQSSTSEQQALIEAVIVPETWFFRYPESFASLSKLVRERVAALKGARPVRILSLPCSTGEEPYSIAMALLDAPVGVQQFQIDAMDISPVSIARAERGVYGKNSFRGADTLFRERYFTPLEDGFLVDKRVRDCVRFRPANLLDPALLTQTPYDFVFCRNVLIYFDQVTQKQVFEVLKRLTHEEGVLFIGPAEGSLLTRMGMRSIGIPQTFAFSHCVEAPQPVSVIQAPLPLSGLARSMPGTSVAPPVRMPVRAFPRLAAPASFAVRPTVVPAPASPVGGDNVATLLATIASLANEGRSAEARTACERFLQHHEPVAQIFYWLGLLSEVEGNAALAQGFYRKALYLDPQHAETLAQLAALLEAQGDRSGARRLQERAARGASRQGGGQ